MRIYRLYRVRYQPHPIRARRPPWEVWIFWAVVAVIIAALLGG